MGGLNIIIMTPPVFFDGAMIVFLCQSYPLLTIIQTGTMKRLRNKYPLKQLLQDLREELNQNEIITMEHLLECRKLRLLDFDDNYVYGYVDISE